MASGTLGAEEAGEKPRWNESSKVYARRIKNKNAAANLSSAAAAPAAEPIATAAATPAAANQVSDAAADAAGPATSAAAVPAAEPIDTVAAPAAANQASDAAAYAAGPATSAAAAPAAEPIDTVTAPATANQASDAAGPATTAAADENLEDVARTDEGNVIAQAQDSNALPAKDGNHQEQQPDLPSNSLRIEVGSDGSAGLNREEGAVIPNSNGGRLENGVSINLSASMPKQEARELKRKLMADLDQVRTMAKRLEAKSAQLFGNDHGGGPTITADHQNLSSGGVRANSDGGFRRLSVSIMDSNQEIVEKRTPKANQFYKNSDFICGKDKLPPTENIKKMKSNGKKKHHGNGGSMVEKLFKKCSTLLQQVMKHKHAWVFNEPVDVKVLGLHDYFDIIKHPMDLGTVKDKLEKNWYKSPLEFAEDVRLTFQNAMTYNPEGQDVHVMAAQLSNVFESKWAEVEAEYRTRLRLEAAHEAGLPTPTSRLAPAPFYGAAAQPKVKPVHNAPVGRTPALRKPKAKDPNKRDMTFDEKQKLSTNLQNLPPEKLDSIVQIIRRRNSSFSQHDDEIEVDIDSVDAETLWELERFVTNYKKTLSKHKRKAELALQRAEAQRAMQAANPAQPGSEAPRPTVSGNANAATNLPAQERKQTNGASSSSSSSSSSSDSGSSSDSDSDSSSSDSDRRVT